MRIAAATSAVITIAVLLLAIVTQVPIIQDMVSQLLRQPAAQSVRRIFSPQRYIIPAFLPTFLNFTPPHTPPSSTRNSIQPQRSLNTTTARMADTKTFMKAVAERRTYYQLSPESTISDDRIKELVTQAITYVPSAFNSQTTRLVVVLKDQHKKLWDSISDVYKAMLPPEKFEHAAGRFQGFRNSYGTILFYEDTVTMREFQDKFKSYQDKFPAWTEHTSGMHQYVLWTALEAEGLGVNLQHYNPPIDKRLEAEYSVPETWNLKAQMVFGKPVGQPGEKAQKPIDERVKFFG